MAALIEQGLTSHQT